MVKIHLLRHAQSENNMLNVKGMASEYVDRSLGKRLSTGQVRYKSNETHVLAANTKGM